MSTMNLLVLVFGSVFLSHLTFGAPYRSCKAVPGKPDWPSPQNWADLNRRIDGRLVDPTPVFAVCHPKRPEYNEKTCEAIKGKHENSLFMANQPIGIDYNDQGCLPNPKYPCDDDIYPVYVVNASHALHVKHAIDFARKHKIRLVVKGTGHDYNRRSTARDSLSIWTHHLNEFHVHENFKPFNCDDYDVHPAVTVGAGYQMRDLISDVGKHGRVVVAGADPDVGIGGFLSAGGHSPISHIYGLGADQILEMEVVTAAGDILKVNEKCHSDLFWAVRGGGPSHAVMVSVTLKTFPTSRVAQMFWQVNSTSTHYWDIITHFHSQLPALSDQGLMGYYYAVNLGQVGGQLSGTWLALNSTKAETEEIFSKFVAYVQNTPNATYQAFHLSFKTFAQYQASVEPETVGSFGRLGSRLIGEEALKRNTTALKNALRTSTPPSTLLIGHLIAGKGVANAKIPGGSDSVLPAWRRAYVHLVSVASWKPFDHRLKEKRWKQLTDVRVKALADLDPDSGSYVNEGDPHEPNWQHTFWGLNYARLFKIKTKWDPEGVFYCFPCVGAEEWKDINGTLCRA